jgi:hypothetical protein
MTAERDLGYPARTASSWDELAGLRTVAMTKLSGFLSSRELISYFVRMGRGW